MQRPSSDVCPSRTPGSEDAPSSPVRKKPNSGDAANVSLASLKEESPVQDAGDASPSQKERWFQTMKLNQVLPQFTASGPTANSAFDNDSVKGQSTGGPLGGSITSPQSRSSGTTLEISAPSVPPNRVTLHPSGTTEACQLQSKMSAKGSSSSTSATPRPGAHGPATPSPKAQQHKAQVGCNQPDPLNVDITTGLKIASSAHPASPLKAGRSGAANAASQVGQNKSALGPGGSDNGLEKTGVSPALEEERVAKRREQWRIKKREQRKKSRERTQFTGTATTTTTFPRPGTQKTGVSHCGGLKHPPPLSSVQSGGPKQSVGGPRPREAPADRLAQNARVILDSSSVPRLAGTAVKKEERTIEASGPARANPGGPGPNPNTVFLKVQNPQVTRRTQPSFVPNVKVERRIEYPRKFSNHTYFSNVSRGIARCRTPRQKLIETQKCFSNQRNARVKFPSLAAMYNSRNVPKILPNESPEQTASRRREYWRIKKREQRAKQSLEVKAQLKEKDSLMRRVKRYQKILEEMRRARAQTAALAGGRSPGAAGMLGHASETIGGFIKEDGTVTVSLPPVPMDTAAAGHEAEQTSCLLSEDGGVVNDDEAHPWHPPVHVGSLGHSRDATLGYSGRLGHRPPPPPLRPAQVRVTLPRDGPQSANKPPRLLSIRPRTHFQRSAAANSNRSPAHNPAQITLTHPPFPLAAGSEVSATGVRLGGGVGGGNGGGGGGCVMKMAVSSLLAAPVPPPCEDPGLTEEQRMAKKREYWRVKKREQRAARATKLKHGLVPAWDAAMQRMKTHKQTPIQRSAATANTTTTTQIRNSAKQKMNILPSCNVNVPNPQQAKQIKVEREPVPASDLNIKPEQSVCPIKLAPLASPRPPPPPPAVPPQPEPDPTLSAETQATTLLAVASMKKLLEESLSTVTECQPANIKTEPPPCKTEREDYVSGEHLVQEMKPEIPEASLDEDDKLPLAANLTLQIKSWQADPDDLAHASPPDPHPDTSTQTGKPPPPTPPLSSATQVPQCPAQPLSPLRRAKRLCTKKSGSHHQNCCSPEPPKSHHSPATQQQSLTQRAQPASQPPRCLPQPQPSAPQLPLRRPSLVESVGVEGSISGGSSLQEKREYWKLKKRQQRARSKARQKNGLGHRQNSKLSSQNNVQPLNHLSVNNASSGRSQTGPPVKRVLQPKVPTATLTAVHSIPTLLVVSPTASTEGRSPHLLQVKPPVCSSTSPPLTGRGRHEVNAQPSGTSCDPDTTMGTATAAAANKVNAPSSDGVLDGEPRLVEKPPPVTQRAAAATAAAAAARKWTAQENSNAAPALATLTPPDNPLSSINLFPIEPLVPTSGSSASYGGPPKPAHHAQPTKPKPAQASPTKLLPISTLAPPKPIPGESQEEFLRRKREYWRVKKKEQRARKAIRDRELSQRRAPGNWKPIRPAKDQDRPHCMENQDPGDCDPAYEDSEHLMSSTSDAEMGYYSYSSDTVPLEDGDRDACFSDHGGGGIGSSLLLDGDHHHHHSGGGGDDFGAISDGAWRSRYLMDHDPLNQLLVCMVCGDLLYSHSLEGVRAHIEEAHPDTLHLEPPECRRILDAWDEQVSQRERFFTSQLQQHGATLAEASGS